MTALRRPAHPGWKPDTEAAARGRLAFAALGMTSVLEAWRYRGILVISALETVDDGRGPTPTWHLSITEAGRPHAGEAGAPAIDEADG